MISRRAFLQGALAGGALCLGAQLSACGNAQERRIRHAKATGELRANIFITVMPSGRVLLAINKCEIGQGISTAYATLVAEELEVELDEVDFYYADSLPHYRTSTEEGLPLWRIHLTGGSSSTKEAYIPLRRAAAAAKEMLIAAAARQWRVKPRDCHAEAGKVHHKASQRSLGFGELTTAAARESVPEKARIKERSAFRLIGKAGANRVDRESKVRGTAIFSIDVKVPNMVRALVLHAPHYNGRAQRIDEGSARTEPGVIDIFGIPGGVAIVAEKYWQCLRAARSVSVTWKGGTTRGLDSEEFSAAARAFKKPGARLRDDKDLSAAMAKKSATALEATYEAPYLAHAPMEPQNCIVHTKGESAEVWGACQIPTVVQESLADALDIDAEEVLVHTTYGGGGFGRRLVADYAVQAARISKKVKRPVQLIWSRESDTQQGFYRPAATIFMRGAVRDKRLDGLGYHSLSQPIIEHQFESSVGGLPSWMPGFWKAISAKTTSAMFTTNTMVDMFATEGVLHTPYKVPNLQVDFTPTSTGIPVGFWRGVGHSFNAFGVESFVDELAHAAGVDPLAFRQQMLAPNSRELRVLNEVAELGSWQTPAEKGYSKGLARHTAFGTEVAQIAEAGIIDGRIRIKRVFCVVDCGVVINPEVVVAQMQSGIIFGISAALDQKITFVDGVVQEGNFDSYPVLRMHECPEIIVKVLESDKKPTGVGEPGLPPIAPAIGNALFAQHKLRLRSLPMQPSLDARGESL